MNHVILWELNRRRTAIIWWTIGSVAMTALIVALYPSIRDQAAQMNQVINQLPPELRGLKTGGSSAVDVGDPLQFLNSQLLYATLPMIWIILAITRGSGILGLEERDRTLELLLARPISRTRLLLSKVAALLAEFALITGATTLGLMLLAPLFKLHVPAWHLLIATIYTAAFCLSFGYIAFALQAASRMTKRAATVFAVAVSFGGYILASLSSLTDWLEIPAKFSPFHYFTPLTALRGETPRGLLVYVLFVFVLGTVGAFIGFRRRDIE
ncbi:MAG: ABC transporter permease subunit [Candidatus Saccharimonadales bacterium]